MKEKYTEESKVQPVTNTAYEAKTKYKKNKVSADLSKEHSSFYTRY